MQMQRVEREHRQAESSHPGSCGLRPRLLSVCVSHLLSSSTGSIHEQVREVFIFDELLQCLRDV